MIRERLDGSHADLEERRAELKQAGAAEAAQTGSAGATVAAAAVAAASGAGGETARRLLTLRWLVAQGSLLQRALEATEARLADLQAEATANDGGSSKGDASGSGGVTGNSSDGGSSRTKRARRK